MSSKPSGGGLRLRAERMGGILGLQVSLAGEIWFCRACGLSRLAIADLYRCQLDIRNS